MNRSRSIQPEPTFAQFARRIELRVSKMLATDATGRKLDRIAEALPHLVDPSERAVVERIKVQLVELGKRSERLRRKLRKRFPQAFEE